MHFTTLALGRGVWRQASPVAADPAADALHQTAAFSGFAAYVLMVGTIVWGVATATGFARRNIARDTVFHTHTALAVGALAFIATHVVANVVAPAAGLSIWAAIVPYAGTSTAISLGVIGLELTVVAAASNWFRRLLSYRAWHRVHLLAYPAYGLSILHVVVAGSDVREPLLAALLAVTFVVVALVVVARIGPSLAVAVRPAGVKGHPEAAGSRTTDALTIRVDVDHLHCGRFAMCQQEAPEVFQVSSGRLRFQHSPDPRHLDAVRQAARVCPMQAISVEERA